MKKGLRRKLLEFAFHDLRVNVRISPHEEGIETKKAGVYRHGTGVRAKHGSRRILIKVRG